jgi:Uma2 family endonuclease
LGADGLLQMLPGLVRIPDVSFVCWERLPVGLLPRRPTPALVPELVVEVLAEGNTSPEMEAKLRTDFQAAVQLIWYIDPSTHTATIYTSPTTAQYLDADGVLDGGDVLPRLQLSLRHLFVTAERRRPS